MHRRSGHLVVATALLLALAACGSATPVPGTTGPTAAPAGAPGTSGAPEDTAAPGATPAPTRAPEATAATPTAAPTPEPTPAPTPAPPAAFELTGPEALLPVTADGGGVALDSGTARAAVRCPGGAFAAGTTLRIHALGAPPAASGKALTPGIWIDSAGAQPASPCAIGFVLPGKASADAAIVRLADDGSVAEVIATSRVVTGGKTYLTGYVDHFSAYTTAEEDKAARDKAFTDRAKARGKAVDWTIKVSGTETQRVEGWTFVYDVDLFASGGDIEMGGVYKGHAQLNIKGTYKGNLAVIKSVGKIVGEAKDTKLTFFLMDSPLVDLLTGAPVGDPIVGTVGVMNLKGFGSLDITATGPNVQGHVNKDAKGSQPLIFSLKVSGDDVQLEIKNVGIFGGKILRTTK